MGHWVLYSVEKYCFRCTHEILNEEKYLLFKAVYCRACMDTIENDPDYGFIFKRSDIFVTREAKTFWKLNNIEN